MEEGGGDSTSSQSSDSDVIILGEKITTIQASARPPGPNPKRRAVLKRLRRSPKKKSQNGSTDANEVEDDGLPASGELWVITYIHGAVVREGSLLSSERVTDLSRGTAVTVVEIRGRRARITAPVRGWLSLTRRDGLEIASRPQRKKKRKTPSGGREDRQGTPRKPPTIPAAVATPPPLAAPLPLATPLDPSRELLQLEAEDLVRRVNEKRKDRKRRYTEKQRRLRASSSPPVPQGVRLASIKGPRKRRIISLGGEPARVLQPVRPTVAQKPQELSSSKQPERLPPTAQLAAVPKPKLNKPVPSKQNPGADSKGGDVEGAARGATEAPGVVDLVNEIDVESDVPSSDSSDSSKRPESDGFSDDDLKFGLAATMKSFGLSRLVDKFVESDVTLDILAKVDEKTLLEEIGREIQLSDKEKQDLSRLVMSLGNPTAAAPSAHAPIDPKPVPLVERFRRLKALLWPVSLRDESKDENTYTDENGGLLEEKIASDYAFLYQMFREIKWNGYQGCPPPPPPSLAVATTSSSPCANGNKDDS